MGGGAAPPRRKKKEGEPLDLWDYIEKIGPYHLMFFGLGFLPAFLNGVQAVNFSFTEAVPDLRCCAPEFENCSTTTFNSPVFNNTQLKNQHWFAGEKGKYCAYCPQAMGPNDTCTKDNSVACNASYVFDKSLFPSSVVLDFNMYCGNDWMYELVQTMFLFGYTSSGFVSGLLADRFGRRAVLLGSTVVSLVSYVLTPLIPVYGVYVVLSALNGLISDTGYLTAFVVLMEISDSRWRTVLGLLYQCFFSLSYPFVGLLAPHLKHDWKLLYWIVSSPVLFFVFYFWLFPESLRWTVSKRREGQTMRELARFKRWNKEANIPDEVVQDALAEADLGANAPKEGFMELFKHWETGKNTVILFFTWWVAAMSYYGLALNTNDLPGNVYENFIMSGMADILGYFITIPLLEYWGRRPPLIMYWVIGGLGCIAAGLTPATPANTPIIVACAMIGKICVASVFAVVYNYTSELYPTSVRQTACGLCSMFAHVGAMAAPQIHLLKDVGPSWLPIVIFGVAALIAAVLDIFLPETRGRPMPQTIEQAIRIANGEVIEDEDLEGAAMELQEKKKAPKETKETQTKDAKRY